MALKRVTKSIPLSGGISEDAPEFLLEPPGMAYIENARFRKVDLAEKTEGLAGDGLSTGATQFSPSLHDKYGTISAWSKGTQMAVVGKSEVARKTMDQAAFEQVDIETTVLGIERILGTATAIGAQNADWCFGADGGYDDTTSPYDTLNINYFAVAYETRRNQSDDQAFVNVVFQTYNLDGSLLTTETIELETCPRLRMNASGGVVMKTICHTDNIVYGDSWIVNRQYTQAAGLTYLQSQDLDIRPYPQEYTQATQLWDVTKPESMRISFAKNANHTPAMCFDMDSRSVSGTGLVAYKTEATGQIRTIATYNTGLHKSTSYFLTQDVEPTIMYRVLDCRVGRRAAPNDHSYVLISYIDTSDTSNPYSTVICIVCDRDTGAPTTTINFGNVEGHVYNGSLDEMSNGYIAIAVSSAKGHPSDGLDVNGSSAAGDRITFKIAANDFSTIKYTKILIHHRLVSRLKCDEDDNPHGVVQQYFSAMPDNFGADQQKPSIMPAATKPVTSVLIRFTDDPYALETVGDEAALSPIAVFDPGTSKMGDHSLSEQSVHLPELDFLDDIMDTTGAPRYDTSSSGKYQRVHQWFYLNRVMDTLEDLNVWLHNSPNATGIDARRLLRPSDGHFNLFRCSPDIKVQTVDFHNGFFNTAAIPAWYDGGVYGESMVLDQPEIVWFGGSTLDPSYLAYQDLEIATEEAMYAQAIIGFTDDAGMVHRSAPSFPLFAGNMGPPATTTAKVTAQVGVTRPLSMFHNREYFIEVYYGGVGTTAKLGASTTIPTNIEHGIPINLYFQIHQDPLASAHDIEIVRGSKPLYTEGNVLPADPWPNVDLVTATARRLFATSLSAPGDVFYSKIFESGLAPEFSAPLLISVGTGRKITALGSVDDKVACFFEDGIYIIYGQGPDNTGANGDFFTELLNTKVGCTDPESIVTVPDGIMFYSSTTEKFHVLTRDMQIMDIGRPIEDITGGNSNLNILDAIEYPTEHEVRFFCKADVVDEYGHDPTTGTGYKSRPPRPRFTRALPNNYPVMVYNYEFRKWTVLTNVFDQYFTKAALHDGKPAMISNTNVYYRLEDDPDIWYQSPLMKWETPWIKINQLQDFGRIYELTILGKYLSNWWDESAGVQSGDLQVTVRYDYEGVDGFTDVKRFRANSDFDPANGERLQFSIKPTRQKCQSIKLEIEEIATTAIEVSEPTYATGRGFELTAVDLHYGAKGGSSRLSAGRKK